MMTDHDPNVPQGCRFRAPHPAARPRGRRGARYARYTTTQAVKREPGNNRGPVLCALRHRVMLMQSGCVVSATALLCYRAAVAAVPLPWPSLPPATASAEIRLWDPSRPLVLGLPGSRVHARESFPYSPSCPEPAGPCLGTLMSHVVSESERRWEIAAKFGSPPHYRKRKRSAIRASE